MEWNGLAKKWSNETHVSKPPFAQLNCPSLEFLRAMAHACENSDWCCSWEIIDAHGRAVDCAAADIPDFEVEFDEPPVEHHDETINADICADVRALMWVRQLTHHTRRNDDDDDLTNTSTNTNTTTTAAAATTTTTQSR